MNIVQRTTGALVIAAAVGVAPMAAHAQQHSDRANAVPISTVLDAVAKRSGKKFIVDPRVQGDILLVQENPSALSYDDLLMVLNVHGFAAVTSGQYVRVVPDASVRQMALPLADKGKHPPAEYVTKIVPVKSIPAPQLVPVLRPLIPQQGHLVAIPCTNDLIVVDTFGNIRRLEQVIAALDRGEAYVPPKCEATAFAQPPRKDGDK